MPWWSVDPLSTTPLDWVGAVPIMTSVQTNPMTDTTFNGWANWETWNVSLWIQNDEGLYNEARRLARFGRTYQDLVNVLRECGSKETPDGCRWDDPAIDGLEINEMMEDL